MASGCQGGTSRGCHRGNVWGVVGAFSPSAAGKQGCGGRVRPPARAPRRGSPAFEQRRTPVQGARFSRVFLPRPRPTPAHDRHHHPLATTTPPMHLQVPRRTRALAARQPSRRTAKQRLHGRPAQEPPEGQHESPRRGVARCGRRLTGDPSKLSSAVNMLTCEASYEKVVSGAKHSNVESKS